MTSSDMNKSAMPIEECAGLSQGGGPTTLSRKTKRSNFRHFCTSPRIIRLVVMMYIRFPLSSRNVENVMHEQGI